MSDAQHSSGRAARRHAIAFLTIYALHLCLVIYALPPVEVFGGRPWASPDYQTHYGQTTTLIQVAEQFGKLWAYDPSVLAGHPVGLIFDVDNKAHFLFTYALTRLGVSTASAFNLFTVVSCLLAPLCVWLTARLFRLGPREQLIALGLAVLLWHFDSASRAWTGGMISFSTVSFGALPVLALFYRLLERPS